MIFLFGDKNHTAQEHSESHFRIRACVEPLLIAVFLFLIAHATNP